MKRVLITGAAGFIGSQLAKELLRKNYEVIGLDNFSQGFKRNILPLLKNASFHMQEGDVRDLDFLRKIAKNAEGIFHLAAFKIPRYGHALDTLTINVKGTENVLEIAKENHCKVVFSSTSDVYGKNPDLPFRENSNLVLGESSIKRWSYAVSKIFDEQLCFAYHEEYGVPISIVRYFGGYGPHQNTTWWGGPQAVFIECALSNQKIPIHGDGNQTRSFTFISDIIEGTITAFERENANGQIFNIGCEREISIFELGQLIWKMIRHNEDPKFHFIPYENFGKYEDVKRRIPDISKAKALLNFEAKVNLEEGLPMTIEWQKNIRLAS